MFDDFEFMNNPDLWHGPYCCVKRYPTNKSPFEFPVGDNFGVISAVNGVTVPIILRRESDPLMYDSVRSILNDGWIVD